MGIISKLRYSILSVSKEIDFADGLIKWAATIVSKDIPSIFIPSFFKTNEPYLIF